MSHAVAAQKWLKEPFDGNQTLKDELLETFNNELKGREVLVGPKFHTCTFYVDMETPDGTEEKVQKNFIVWVAKTTNFDGKK